jgi:hypothetical protein
VVFVDAGDFTGEPTVPGQKQTDALIEGMNLLGYRVAALSQRELAHGYDTFLARRSKATFPFVSANIVWQDSGDPLVDPFVVLRLPVRKGAKAKEVRIAFTGLTAGNPAFLKIGPGGRRIVTADPLAAAVRYVPEMRAKADVVVVLSGLDLDAARKVAHKVKVIDLILGGQGGRETRIDDFPEDTLIGRTRIQYVGDQGKNVGDVRLFLSDKRTIASVQRSLVSLTREWPDEPVLARLMESTKVDVNAYNQAQAEANSPFAAPERPAASAPTFTGSERCLPCHESEFTVWSKSAHAHAFETLVQAKQDFNPTCVGCHTIGYGSPQGFRTAVATPGLKHVGCEACHGPSSQHPEPLAQGYGKTTTEACRGCHTSENSPDFDPGTYIPQVKHWKETQAAR